MNELPSNWISIDLEEAFAPLEDGRTMHHGWSPQCEKEPSDSEDIWGVLKTTAVQPGAFWGQHNKRLPDKLSPRPLLEVHEGDLLITSAGPRARCGVACLVRDVRPRLILSGKMYRFRIDERLMKPEYVEAYLQSPAATLAIDRMKTGISDSGLNLTHERFRKLPIPLPPLEAQDRIVAAIDEQFSRLDAAESDLSAALARLTTLYGATVSGAVAGDWPSAPLGDLLREPLRNGHSAKASRDGTVRTLTLTAVTQGAFVEENTKLTAADPKRVENLWLRSGDVLIERSNTPELVGTAALYRGPDRWAIFPDLLIRIRVNDDILPEFLEIVLKSHRARQYFRAAAQGIAGSMPKIDQGAVERFSVPMPRVDEQRRIVDEVERQFSVIAAMRATVEKASRRSNSLRRSILERAFNGQLTPESPSDEPALALLERVRAQRAETTPPKRRRKVTA